MLTDAYLDRLTTRVRSLIDRANAAAANLSSAQMNWSPGEGKWSIGQIFEHMSLADTKYLLLMRDAFNRAPESKQAEIKHSWIGGVIIKGSGPQGNAPSPKALHPGKGPFAKTVLERFESEHEVLIGMAENAKGRDLSTIKFKNPFIKMFTMNMADGFEILAVHAERHVGQIERIIRRPDFPAH